MKLESHAYIKFPCGTEMETGARGRNLLGKVVLPELLPPTLCPLHGANCKPLEGGGNGHAMPKPDAEITPPVETMMPEIAEEDDPNKPEIIIANEPEAEDALDASIQEITPMNRAEIDKQLADAEKALAEILGVNPPPEELMKQAEPAVIQGQVLPQPQPSAEEHPKELPPLEPHPTIQTKKPTRRR